MTYLTDLSEAAPGGTDQYLNDIARTPLLSADEERTLAYAIRDGCQESRARMIVANLRLVVKVAKPYARRGILTMDECISFGNEGLMLAVDKFDPDRGHKFSTMATWWIRQAIQRACCDHGRLIRLPVHLVERWHRIQRFVAQCDGMAHPPTAADIGAALDLTEKQVRDAQLATRETLSLNYPLDDPDDDGREYGAVVASDEPAVDEQAAATLLKAQVAALLAKLPERERAILTLRYGLADGRHRTLEEVGVSFGITRERVRQIEKDALNKLRHPAFGGALRGYLR